MTVIYVLTKIFTFPGTLTKAFFEQIMCRVFKTPVEDNRYIRTDEMCGHIEHEMIERPAASYFYCFIPGLLNFILGVVLLTFAAINIGLLGNYTGFISSSGLLSQLFSTQLNTNTALINTLDFLLPWFFMWMSFSMFVNMAPLVEDSLVMKEQYSKLNIILKIIFFPGYIVMRIGARLENLGLTFLLFAAAAFAMAVL